MTATVHENNSPPSRWLFVWAVITALATLPLLTLGAEVTTKKVGMVDKVGFREPWHLAKVWQQGTLAERGLGYVIEHSHRIAGFVVGICAIILALGLWLGQPHRWLKWLGLAGLLAVSAQGVLGIFRVNLNAMLAGKMGVILATIHGITAQLVFALLVSIAVLTSRTWWRNRQQPRTNDSGRLHGLAKVVLLVVFVQLVLGAEVRHRTSPIATRLHVVAAFLVVVAAGWLIRELFAKNAVKRAGVLLAVVLFIQIVLGVESWLSKFQVLDRMTREPLPPLALHPDLIRSLHYVGGALVFATAMAIVLLTWRQKVPQPSRMTNPDHQHQLEGVA